MKSNLSQFSSSNTHDRDSESLRLSGCRAVVKVPGKLMLAGEYAVLAGQPALATTLDQHLTVRASLPKATARRVQGENADLVVTSDLWSPTDLNSESPLHDFSDSPSSDVKSAGRPSGAFRGYRINPKTGMICVRQDLDFGGDSSDHSDPQESLGAGVSESVYDGLHFTPPPSHRPLIQAALEGARAFGIDSGSIHVSSELDIRHGFGSSSALYLGVLTALAALKIPLESQYPPLDFLKSLKLPSWFLDHRPQVDLCRLVSPGEGPTPQRAKSLSWLLWGVARLAFSLQWESQKRGSGYDTITQLLGGIVQSQPFSSEGLDGDSFVPSQQVNASHGLRQETLAQWPYRVETINNIPPSRMSKWVHLFVGGQGAPTGPLVRSTMGWMLDAEQKGFLRELCARDQQVQKAALGLLKMGKGDQETHVKSLMGAVGQHRRLLKKMPQYPNSLAQSLEKIPGCDHSWSFKTTGAGGEDALLVWGELAHLGEVSQCLRKLGWKRHNVGFDRFGINVQLEGPNPGARPVRCQPLTSRRSSELSPPG
jgi:hypothetical protein